MCMMVNVLLPYVYFVRVSYSRESCTELRRDIGSSNYWSWPCNGSLSVVKLPMHTILIVNHTY